MQFQQLGLLPELLEVIFRGAGCCLARCSAALLSCSVLSCRFSGELTRTVSAVFLLLPPPPSLAPSHWELWLGEGGWKMLFCFTWIPEPAQGLGNGLSQFPSCTMQDTAPSKPFSCPGAVRLLLNSLQDWFCLCAQFRVSQSRRDPQTELFANSCLLLSTNIGNMGFGECRIWCCLRAVLVPCCPHGGLDSPSPLALSLALSGT